MSQPPIGLDYETPRPINSRENRQPDQPLAKAVRMVAYAIVILAGAILCGLGVTAQTGPITSPAVIFGGWIMFAGGVMMLVAMFR